MRRCRGQEIDSPGGAGGSVPATLSLTLGAPATFGAFTPGVAQGLHGLDDGQRRLHRRRRGPDLERAGPPDQRHVLAAVAAAGRDHSEVHLDGPVSNESATIDFTQPIGANDALRTGSYSKTLTFTLSTTNP